MKDLGIRHVNLSIDPYHIRTVVDIVSNSASKTNLLGLVKRYG